MSGEQVPLRFCWLGRRPYTEMFELQNDLHLERRAGRAQDTLLFLEHSPVITQGRGTKSAHILSEPSHLDRLGVELIKSDRGGDVTLHAPGQLIAYPIVTLPEGYRDVRAYVNALTQAMQKIALSAGVDAGAFQDKVGCWIDREDLNHYRGDNSIDPAKIGAIGVKISRWVTLHGFALNLFTDLELFRLIVPCGIPDYPVARLSDHSPNSPSPKDACPLAAKSIAEYLKRPLAEVEDLSQLSSNELRASLLQPHETISECPA